MRIHCQDIDPGFFCPLHSGCAGLRDFVQQFQIGVEQAQQGIYRFCGTSGTGLIPAKRERGQTFTLA